MLISIIEPVGGHGGMNYYNTGLSTGLVENSTRVNLYTCPESKEKGANGLNILKPFKGVYGKDNKALRTVRYIKALLYSMIDIKKNKGTFCHLHFFQYSALELATCLLAKMFRIKVIATIHDVEAFAGDGLSSLQGYIFKLVDHLIVHNEFSRKELAATLKTKGIHKEISTIQHGNYLPFISPVPAYNSREKLSIPQDKKIILFFGQIKKVKGLDHLLEALPKIIEKEPNVVLVLAGKVWKDTFETYQNIIDNNGTGSNIIQHIRYIPDDQVDYYYSAADVVALPYKKIYQSGVLLMAMSYGCVTASSRLPAMEEVITDGINGYMFNLKDPSDLANVLLKALDTKNRQNISNAAVATMKTNHDWTKLASQHLEVYKKHVL